MNLHLHPTPQSIQPGEGKLTLPRTGKIVVSTPGTRLVPAVQVFADKVARTNNALYYVSETADSSEAFISVSARHKDMGKEAYQIEITPQQVIITAGGEAGGFYALQTLAQIFAQSRGNAPALTITDQPGLKQRGFMLDISRCKVPTLESLITLVDLLATFKYNEFQLYMEHTFAFRGHQDVWVKASPLTGDEIKKLDEHCRARFIDLVPNFNSFGHFERWLRYPRYYSLAECPRGFAIPELNKFSDHGTTLRPTIESVRFLKTLYDDLLPNFSSDRFNIGGDEPWELGYGHSKERVEREGKHRVYLDFMKEVLGQVHRLEKTPLFWADILLESPDLAEEVPSYARPVIWGYDDTHPFDLQTAIIANAGLNFYVAPGTSAWNTFTGRFDNMLANVENALKHAREHKAEGMLMTSWGDNGNHQPLPVLYPGLVAGGCRSWNTAPEHPVTEETLSDALSRFVFHDMTGKLAEGLIKLGKTEALLPGPNKNQSLLFELFFANNSRISSLIHTFDTKSLQLVEEHLELARTDIQQGMAQTPDAPLLKQELLTGLEMARWAIHRGQKMLGSTESRPDGEIRDRLQNRIIPAFKELWQRRNRPGGSEESFAALEVALDRLAEQRGIDFSKMAQPEKLTGVDEITSDETHKQLMDFDKEQALKENGAPIKDEGQG